VTVDLDSQSDSTEAPELNADFRHRHARGALSRSRPLRSLEPLGQIGRYTVLGQIAGGGMGSVFVGLMRGPASFSRLVAIKCLHTRWLEDEKYVARFATEVRLSTRIRHPNVVQTLDVVEEDGELFLVMEYVDGVTLGALLADIVRQGRRMPVDCAASIMVAVLRGLHAAHETTDEHGVRLDIVHRDVSPQNIMVSRSGHVMVLDFGAAKATEHSQHTAAGVLVGKLAYMAPEQVRGERSSARTDVFAAGVVLWEALVGKRLFHDPSLARGELLLALALKPVARPSQLRPGVHAALDEVVKKALERNPDRRYQTALEFALALEAACVGATEGELGHLVTTACGPRLAEKAGLVQRGMDAASEEVSAAVASPRLGARQRGHALTVAGAGHLPDYVAPRSPRVVRRPSLAWAGALLLVGLAAFCWGHARRSVLAPVPSAALLPPAPSEVPPSEVAPPPQSAAPEAEASEAPRPRSAPARRGNAGRRASHGAQLAEATSSADQRVGGSPEAALGVKRAREACDPPTYMDEMGIRHFKRGCL
jgi:eukaryotic-like serine/threonine-protein kinase